jgi:glucosamine-6-phosphate deaminase
MKHFSLPKDGGLLIENIPEGIIHACDKVVTDVFGDADAACRSVSKAIVEAINNSDKEKAFKLGFSTGTTLTPLFRQLCKQYDKGAVSFKNVEIFTTDEYYFKESSPSQRRNDIIRSEFLSKTDIQAENVNILGDSIDPSELAMFDEKAKGLDLLVMGIGEEGQIGFNESGSEEYSRTRIVMLSYNSRKRQARNYFRGDINSTPRMAVTMGVSTMLSAKKVFLMAWGEDKVEITQKIVEGDYDPACPVSLFQKHHNVRMYVDEGAGSLLTREVAPWLIGPCEWTPKFTRKAVLWLCRKVGKPILKLTEQDYLRNSLDGLLEEHGPYDQINIDIFNDFQHTITGWPGGKPNADDSTRPVASKPFPKKVVIFSPHPDDDVISMGGTFIRLVQQGHDVHVAYQTSGNVAVNDEFVLQHMDAARKLGFEDRFDEVKKLVEQKKPGEPEPRALLDIKAAIRRSEACGACRSFGLNDETNVHFLNLPFYESGGIKKLPSSQIDVDIIKNFLESIKPDQVYMAGDLADPHGTHKVCTEAAMEALEQLREEGKEWAGKCVVWLYRGAWMEWDLGRVDMAAPMSPSQEIEKRHAIFHHLSQKDIVPFPGEDSREFWQRAEDRTQNTARLYTDLGMAQYQAMEVFVKY